MGYGRVIGLTGYAGSGKTTAAVGLVEKGWIRMRFADPLKQMLGTLLRMQGWTDSSIDAAIDGREKEIPVAALCGATPRHALQTLGTEWGRNLISDQIWVNTLMWRARDAMYRGGRVVVDDVRFPNEVEAIKRMGGQVVRVSRDKWGIPGQHDSERLVPTLEVDYEIQNTGSIDQLKSAVAEFVNGGKKDE